MKYDRLRTHTFQKALDRFIALSLLLLLIASAAISYRETKEVALVSGYLWTVSDLRTDILYHHALTGEWPENFSTLIRSRPDSVQYITSEDTDLDLETGAIQLTIKDGPLMGNRLSLQPAVPADNPLGPIVWLAGKKADSTRFTAAGINRTTIDSGLIPSDMK